MRRWSLPLTVSAVVLVQLIALPTSSSADAWAPPQTTPSSVYGLSIVDPVLSFSYASELSAFSTGVNRLGSQTLCSGYSVSGPCQFDAPGTSLYGDILLPVCNTDVETNCVAGMSLGTSADSLQPSTFVRMTNGPTVAADPARGLPEGSTIGLWSSSLANAGGTTTYATYAIVQVAYGAGHYSLTNVTAAVLPYAQVSGAYQTPVDVQTVNPTDGRTLTGVLGPIPGCAWTETGICGRLQDFQTGTVASMTVRLSNQIGGWFKGRLQNPTLSVQPFDSSSNSITVTAQTVPVPQLTVAVPIASATPTVQTYFKGLMGDGPTGGWQLFADDSRSFQATDMLRSTANDTASGVVNTWSFGSFAATGNSCLTDTSHVLGLVTTNSMVYDNQAPTFSNGYLSYQVAGMHYLPDDSLALGTYDMIIADSVARCLYGYSSAPISASVSVTESSGVDNVATTSVTDVGGWLRLSANGFTFSDPTISVKLTQAAAKSKTTPITCAKGTNVKRVTGVSPRCPAGYRARTTIKCTRGTNVKRVTGVSPRCPAGYKRKS